MTGVMSGAGYVPHQYASQYILYMLITRDYRHLRITCVRFSW
jgi:hypothetical protein